MWVSLIFASRGNQPDVARTDAPWVLRRFVVNLRPAHPVQAPRGIARFLRSKYQLGVVLDSVDPDYSPGNKLISGLRDSAVSWAIILPLYWYCERGAVAAVSSSFSIASSSFCRC